MQLIVNGYPRSGTTWLCHLLADALHCPLGGFYDGLASDTPPEHLEREAEWVVYKSHASPLALRMRADSRIVYILRDPRNALLSGMRNWGLEDILGALLHQRLIMQYSRFPALHGTSWSAHVELWLKYAHARVRYEDLVADTEAVLGGLCRSMELPASKDSVAAAIGAYPPRPAISDWHDAFADKHNAAADAMWGAAFDTLGYVRGGMNGRHDRSR